MTSGNHHEPDIRALRRREEIRAILRGEAAPDAPPEIFSPRAPMPTGNISTVIAIGISTGGPRALADVMVALPATLGVPILIVQHMPSFISATMARTLDERCAFRVKEAEDGETVLPDTAYLAPGERQMCVVPAPGGAGTVIRITDDPPEHNCRPSVDYLFRSIARHYPGRATGVIMTGMGNDGLAGLKLLKQNGAVIIAQDEATCTVFGMPKAAIDAGVADKVVPLDRIAGEIMKTVRTA